MDRWLRLALCAGLVICLVSCVSVSPPSTPLPAPSPLPTLTPSPPKDTNDNPVPAPLFPTGLREPVPELRLAFETDRDGNSEIYLMTVHATDDPAPSDPINLTNHPANDHAPAWSPDGRRLAFSSDRDGNPEIYLINSDGTGLTRLTRTDAAESQPDWAPDGTRLVYLSRDGKSWDLYTVPVPKPGKTDSIPRPTRILESTDIVSGPAWAPDGTRIAFSTEPNHYSGSIKATAVDGTSQESLTTGGTYHDLFPTWSPDGGYLAFISEKLGHLRFELFVKAIPDDSPVPLSPHTQLTNVDTRTWQPAWSPDGTRIAFASTADGDNLDLYLLTVPTQADGTLPELVRLTDHPADDEHPSWAPLP